jgi:hypothetical protein
MNRFPSRCASATQIVRPSQSTAETQPKLQPVFHDEAEEVDEVDEAKDGCGGVAWQPYVLTKVNTSNKMLHELAREIRGVEKRRGRRLRATQYKAIFDKWECASHPFLTSGTRLLY